MSKYMGQVFQFYPGGWIFRLKNSKLKPQSLCLCNCHTGPSVLEVNNQKRISNYQQVTKRSKKEKVLCQQVLDSFDQQYNQELGPLWRLAREVLLDPHSWQYAVMLNRFSTVTDITQTLQSQGFSTILPQADASALVYNGPSTVSNFKNQAGNYSLLQTHCISKCPRNDSHDQPGSTSHVLAPKLSSPSACFPSSLQCYIHSYPLRFPSQVHIPGQLKQYYLLNAASLLPVLALKVRDGETILDLCSAPGGKALVIMQCATPEFLCCNEPDPHRQKWLAKTLESFLPHSVTSRVIVSAQDGRDFGHREVGKYDKVLVDAPCSNDRSWLYSPSSQQGEQRLKERAMLPVLQVQLLKSALSAVRPGGVVVYSTCTLSSAENYSVIEMVLKDCPEAEPEDLLEELAVSTSKYFTFFNPGEHTLHNLSHLQKNNILSSNRNRLGILVVPEPGKTWGPMFLSRIKRKH